MRFALAGLSRERLAELAEVARDRARARGADPFAGRARPGQSVFLLAGEVLLGFEAGGTLVVVGGSDETRHALNRRKETVARARAITDVDLSWSTTTCSTSSPPGTRWPPGARARRWRASGSFSLSTLRAGVFAQLPPAHIDELLRRFERVNARAARS